LHGQILHELFERSMENNRFTPEYLKKELEDLAVHNVENLFSTGESSTKYPQYSTNANAIESLDSKLLQDLEQMIPEIKHFSTKFVGSVPTNEVINIDIMMIWKFEMIGIHSL
jgi:hypothetical protein